MSDVSVILVAVAILAAILGGILLFVRSRRHREAALVQLGATPLRYFPAPHVDETRLRIATLLAIQALRAKWDVRVEHGLVGLAVRVMPSMKWRNAAGDWVGGEYLVEGGGIFVVRVCVDLSSLAHEFIHHLEARLDGVSDTAHAHWADRGMWTVDNAFRNKLAEVQ